MEKKKRKKKTRKNTPTVSPAPKHHSTDVTKSMISSWTKHPGSPLLLRRPLMRGGPYPAEDFPVSRPIHGRSSLNTEGLLLQLNTNYLQEKDKAREELLNHETNRNHTKRFSRYVRKVCVRLSLGIKCLVKNNEKNTVALC